MYRIRPEINVLLRDRYNYEECDEGEASKYVRCQLAELKRKDRVVPSLHISWRQAIALLNLNPEECRLLIASGFNVRTGDENPFVIYMEKRFRHRFFLYANGGWCITTSARGDVDNLIASPNNPIPTIQLEKPIETIVGLIDTFRTLKDDLRLHGVLPEFIGLQEGKNGVFEILATLKDDALRELLSTIEPQPDAQTGSAVSLGRAVMTR
jgi:hypothetical protein